MLLANANMRKILRVAMREMRVAMHEILPKYDTMYIISPSCLASSYFEKHIALKRNAITI